jgi:hypothetical protein
MDLALVAIHIEPGPRAVPLGPAMLASALKLAYGDQLRTTLLDCFLGDSAAACADRILADSPAAVGFSMYVWNRGLTLEVARLLKARRPELLVFAGGSEATADPQGVLEDPGIDLVLPGEGEALIVDTVGRLLRGEVLAAGIRAPASPDLATLPSPFLDGTLDPADYSGQLWELSRGCPFTCDFCFESRGGSGTRRVPMARVEAELRLFEQRLVSQVFVLDPTFNYDKKQAKEVLRLIRRTAPEIHFFFEIRSEFLDRELAGLFASIKCTLQIGLQSARPEVLHNIGRTLDPAAFEAKILLLHEAGASYGFDLIYGLPGDDLEGFRASLDFALALMPNHLDIFRLSVLPGTKLRETAPGFGVAFEPGHPYRVLATPSFSAADLDQAERLAEACDVFYNQGRAVPWFGILLAGLGCEPSELFLHFADYRDAQPPMGVTELQHGFVLQAFEGDPNPALATIAGDLVTWFGHSAALVDAFRQGGKPGTREVHFQHDIEALLEQLSQGITELEDLTFMVPARPARALITIADGEPRLTLVPQTQSAD